MNNMETFYKGLFAAAALVATFYLPPTPSLAAQAFPDRPIRVIVPYAPGGADLQIRALAPTLSKELGQSIVVENRPGGGAITGTLAAMRAAPDGYTLLFTGTAALAVVPRMRKDVGYTLEDFASIGNLTGTPLVLAVRADLPYKTLAQLLEYAKANPGKINMGSAGAGTTTHIVGEELQAITGVHFTHIPFNGVSGAIQGMLGGFTDIVIGVPDVVLPHTKSGKMRVLATLGTKRSEFFPNVPTARESGVELIEVTKFGLFAPRATPPDVQRRLSKALEQAVKTPEYEDIMRKASTTVLYLSPAELQEAVVKESAYWEQALQKPPLADLIER